MLKWGVSWRNTCRKWRLLLTDDVSNVIHISSEFMHDYEVYSASNFVTYISV